jgi:hypothetical protein
VFVETHGRAGVGDRSRERKSPRVAFKPTRTIGLAPAAISHAQQTTFGSPVGPHPQPLLPAAFASASRTQHAFALVGTGPPQHEFAFFLFPISLSVVAVFDIAVLLIQVSTRRSPVNDEDASHCKRTQRAYSSDGRRE